MINGKDYIGKKFEFEKSINAGVDNWDVNYIPAGIDINKDVNSVNNLIYVEFPKDAGAQYQNLKNGNYVFTLEYELKEVK